MKQGYPVIFTQLNDKKDTVLPDSNFPDMAVIMMYMFVVQI